MMMMRTELYNGCEGGGAASARQEQSFPPPTSQPASRAWVEPTRNRNKGRGPSLAPHTTDRWAEICRRQIMTIFTPYFAARHAMHRSVVCWMSVLREFEYLFHELLVRTFPNVIFRFVQIVRCAVGPVGDALRCWWPMEGGMTRSKSEGIFLPRIFLYLYQNFFI